MFEYSQNRLISHSLERQRLVTVVLTQLTQSIFEKELTANADVI